MQCGATISMAGQGTISKTGIKVNLSRRSNLTGEKSPCLLFVP